MASVFEQMNQGALGSIGAGSDGKEGSSLPILKLVGLSDPKVDIAGLLSTKGYVITSTVDMMSLFKPKSGDNFIKGLGNAGGANSGGGISFSGSTDDISAPSSWAQSVASSRNGQSDDGRSR
jgi:hypothetical protein